jgi:hypothetical protein
MRGGTRCRGARRGGVEQSTRLSAGSAFVACSPGVELIHMLKKGQLVVEGGVEGLTPAEQFYVLAV